MKITPLSITLTLLYALTLQKDIKSAADIERTPVIIKFQLATSEYHDNPNLNTINKVIDLFSKIPKKDRNLASCIMYACDIHNGLNGAIEIKENIEGLTKNNKEPSKKQNQKQIKENINNILNYSVVIYHIKYIYNNYFNKYNDLKRELDNMQGIDIDRKFFILDKELNHIYHISDVVKSTILKIINNKEKINVISKNQIYHHKKFLNKIIKIKTDLLSKKEGLLIQKDKEKQNQPSQNNNTEPILLNNLFIALLYNLFG